MPNLPALFNQGLNTAKDRSDLLTGEMQAATGIYYKPGDEKLAYKIGGRSTFGDTSSAAKIKGLALLKYDSGGIDRLIAYSGNTLYTATPGATGTFAALSGGTGLNASATKLTSVHSNDKWFLGNGYDRNKVVLASGTVRNMGLEPQNQAPTAAASNTASYVNRPSASSGSGFTTPANAYDASTSTYAYATSSSASVKTTMWSGFTAGTAVARSLQVRWGLSALPIDSGGSSFEGGSGGEFEASVLIEYSINGGSTFATMVTRASATSVISANTPQISVSVDPASIQVRATFTYVAGSRQASLRIYDIVVSLGSSVAAFSTSVGMYYALTEYDSASGIESEYVATETLVTTLAASGHTSVIVALPTTAVNSTTTDYFIYRTHDGGQKPRDLRFIGSAKVGETTYVDDFVAFPKDTPGTLSLNLIKVQADPDSDPTYYPANSTPQAFDHMSTYGPFLVGLSQQFPRSLWYCLPGFPEYWPVIYVVTSFPIPERDELVCTATVGDSLIVGALEAIMVIDGLPEASGGVFQSASVRPLRGQPGCVGRYAMCAFSVAGESRCAWVSPFGIHITNGQSAQLITRDLDWSSTVDVATLSSAVLHWDMERRCLVFAYDSDGGGANDRFMLLHMSPEHAKTGGMPKITGPHYGAIACMASGLVSSRYRVWSGHTTNGIAYLENSGVTDTSQAYSSTTVPLILTTPRVYGDQNFFSIYMANLYHTDFGSGQTLSLACTVGWEDSSESNTETETVSLEGHQWDDLFIGMAGNWMEYTLTHTGAAAGAIGELSLSFSKMGPSGRI